MATKALFIQSTCGIGLKHRHPSITHLEGIFQSKTNAPHSQINKLLLVQLVIKYWAHLNVILVVQLIHMRLSLSTAMKRIVLILCVMSVMLIHL